MKRGLKFMCAVGAMGVGFAFTPRAEAITLEEAFAAAFMDSSSPIIMEDDDFQVLVDVDGSLGASIGDRIFGVFLATSINASGLDTPPDTIKDANDTISGNPLTQTLLGNGSSGNNALNAIFAVQILNILANPAGGVDVIVGPLGTTAWAFPGTTGYTAHDPNAIVEIYEDGPGLAGTAHNASASFQTAVNTFTDGNFLATLGFSAPANPLGGANANDEYFFNRDGSDANLIPETFEMNLNFLVVNGAVSNPFSSIIPNDVAGPTVYPVYGMTHQFGLGAGFYGDGTLTSGFALASGEAWSFTSDGNFAVLVPTPAAVWPGLALLGMLAVRRNRKARVA